MGREFNKHENLTILTFWSALQLERYVQTPVELTRLMKR